MIECEILEMTPGEKTILEFEYSSYLSGGILVSPPVVTEDSLGLITTIGVPVISGTKVLVLVTALSSGRSIIKCIISTSLGSISISEQKVFIK